MNQVDDQIDKLDEQFPDSLLRPTQINAQNFAKIDELVTLPYFNLEYAQFMPPSLENQFNFRFSRFSEPYFTPDWAVHPNLRVAVYTYVKNPRGGSKTVHRQPVKQQLKMEYMSTSSNLGVLFKKLRGTNKIRGLSLRQASSPNTPQPNRSNVVLLHDFFQNPLSLIPVINYFVDKQIDVYVPYLADLTAIVKGDQTDEMIKTMADALYWCIKAELGFGIKYQVCAQGTAAILGLTLQDLDLECLKAIIMNPIMRFRIKKPRGAAATPMPEKTRHETQGSDFQSGSIVSTSHSSLRGCDIPLEDYSGSDSQQKEIRTAAPPNAVEITFKRRSRMRRVSHEVPRPPPLNAHNTHKEGLKIMQSARLHSYKFQAGADLTVTANTAGMPLKQHLFQNAAGLNRATISMSQAFNKAVEKTCVEEETLQSSQQQEDHGEIELFEMVNDCLRAVYHDLEILQTILNILGVKKIKDLRPFKTLQDFVEIKAGFTFESSMRQRFLSELLSLLVFDPLEAFVGYNAYKETFDSYFFEMVAEMEYYIEPQTYDFDGPQNVMFLLGSNACMISRQQMIDILTVTEYYITVEARTVLGAGQDLFFSAAVLLEKILLANG